MVKPETVQNKKVKPKRKATKEELIAAFRRADARAIRRRRA